MTTAAIYTRMSKGSELGIARQLQDCRAEAEKRGWTIGLGFEFTDDDVSATKRKPRPAYERMLTAIRAGRVDAVVCWDLDRLTRSPREIEDVLDLADKGLQLATLGGIADLATPQGQMTARIKATVARHEVDQLKRRMRRSLAQRATAGKAHGRTPYGWRSADEALFIREVADRLLAGESIRGITADLNGRAVPSARGGQWSTQVLRTVMLRESNCGRRVHLGEVVGELVGREALVPVDIHDRVVALLRDPSRRSNPGAPKRHLLSKLAVCGLCGAGMTSNPGRPAEKATPEKRAKAPGYVCTNCFGVRRRQSDVDELITDLVIARLEQPDAVEVLARRSDPGAVAAARETVSGLEAKLMRAADDYADDRITAQQLERITARLRPQIAKAEQQIADSLPRADFGPLLGAGARERFQEAPLDIKRAVIDELMTVTILPSGPGRRTFDPSLIRVDWKG